MGDTPMGRIAGKWPGDETEEEITKVLDQLGKCQKCRKLEDLLRWRDVNVEPLPDDGDFLVFIRNKDFPQGVLGAFHLRHPYTTTGEGVTHWMPMLKLPGGE